MDFTNKDDIRKQIEELSGQSVVLSIALETARREGWDNEVLYGQLVIILMHRESERLRPTTTVHYGRVDDPEAATRLLGLFEE